MCVGGTICCGFPCGSQRAACLVNLHVIKTFNKSKMFIGIKVWLEISPGGKNPLQEQDTGRLHRVLWGVF